jgi:hypothetical protein
MQSAEGKMQNDPEIQKRANPSLNDFHAVGMEAPFQRSQAKG